MNKIQGLLGMVLISTAGLASALGPPQARFQVPSAGKHDILLPITQWGRYSIRCAGDQPVSLAIADKRNGVISRDGEPGQSNPRIDLFLDIGTYRLTIQGTKKATGTSTVTATPFALPDDFKPAYLVPLRDNQMSLGDFQRADFWFEAATDTVVYIEAVGRNLADLALWRDGEWLVPTDNHNFLSKPKEETPLSGIFFSARIPKGMYMVGAYGGKGRSWAIRSEDHPLSIQLGMETLAANAMASAAIPARGYAQLLLAPEITCMVIEGADRQRMTAEVNRLSHDFAPEGWVATDSIHAKSGSPRMLLQLGDNHAGNGYRVVKISGTPGQSFTLESFGPSVTSLGGGKGGNWWVSSLHTGNYKDQLGASGLVVERTKGAIVALQADTLSPDREVARKFNLLADMNAFVWVDADGKYSITPGGAAFNWRIRRYFLTPPRNYAPPEFTAGAKSVDLSQGLYILDLSPASKGIANIVLKKASLLGGMGGLGGMIAAGKAAVGSSDREWAQPRPSLRFQEIQAGAGKEYAVILNSQAPELSAVSARPLPINPDEPLGLWCRPGEKVGIPIRLDGRRNVSVTDARGAAVAFEADGKPIGKSAELGAGNHSVTLSGGGSEPLFLMLKSVRPELAASGPPPLFPDGKRAALPRFPVVAAGKTAYLDLDRNGNLPYAVQVEEPGLYRIETTGRLGTGLNLSDRFHHFTRTAQMNGVGRNALLIEYLLPGEYQVSVSAVGQSAGHLGLAVYRNALAEGGALEANIDNRKFIEAFSGADYAVHIPSAGKFHFESIGQKGNFQLRLEDKDGWPFEPAVSAEPLELALAKGDYRLISLPTAQEGRRITRLFPIVEKRSIKGKGPHPLSLNTTMAATWVENPKQDSPGAPAVFTFSLPAPIDARLQVTEGFKAALYRIGPNSQADSLWLSWSGNRKAILPMGNFRITVLPEKKKNYAPYQVSVNTRDLIPGLAYALRKRQTLAISLGTASIVELGSQGMLDVTATLLASDGKTVLAANDDGFLDWNFSISRALKAGRYFLRTESAEPNFTATTVFMRALTDTLMDSLYAVGATNTSGGKSQSLQCNLNRRLGVFPLGSKDAGDILACSAQGKSRIGCSIEKSGPGPDLDEWIPVAQTSGLTPSLSLPRSKDARYRLKVWSESNVDEKITVSYSAPTAHVADWKTAESGLTGQSEPLGADHHAWFKVDLGNHAPGHFRAVADQGQLTAIGVSTALDSVLIDERDERDESATWFASAERYAWIEFHSEQAGRFKIRLEPLLIENGKATIDKPMTMPLVGGKPRVFETRLSKGSLALLSVETDGGTPIAGIQARPDAGATQIRIQGLAVAPTVWLNPGRSATVSLPSDQSRAVIWNALPPLDGTAPSAKIMWTELPLVEAGPLTPGISAWSATKASARKIPMAKGDPVRLRITIPPSGAVLIKRGDGSSALECSLDEPLVREFLTEGGEVYLLALKDKAVFDIATYAISAPNAKDRSAAMADQSLAPETGWQVKLAREGTTLLPVAAKMDKPLGLYYRGAVKNAEWIGGDGLLRANLYNGAPIGPGGILKLTHSEGWAKLDLCDAKAPGDVMACKWGESLSPSGTTEVTQSSQLRLRERANWFSFAVKDTQHVNFSVPLPLSAILLRDGAPLNYQEAWELFNWDLPLPPGKYLLGLHPLAGSSLDGGALSILFRAISPFSEKRPFTTYLAPGESRLLAFDVVKKDKFGIGLRMTKETVQARLYDTKGDLIDQGKQQFVSLQPGCYYLWLRVPEGSEGTEVTANLFGQEPPPNEPPEKLVKWIINGEPGPRPNLQTAAETEPGKQRPEWERFIHKEAYEEGGDGEGYREHAAEGSGEGDGGAEGNQGMAEGAADGQDQGGPGQDNGGGDGSEGRGAAQEEGSEGE